MSNIGGVMEWRVWLMLITLSVLWGGSFFFVGVAVPALPAFTIVLARVALAAVVLLLVLRLAGIPMPTDLRTWRAFFAMGFLNNVIPFLLIVWGQNHIASGVASILNAATPLFTVLLAHWLTRDERMTPNRLIGVVTGFVGVAIMIGADLPVAIGIDDLAEFAILGAGLAYAFAGIYGRRFKTLGISPMATATGQVTTCSVMLLPLVLMVDQPWSLPMPSASVWASLVGLALLSTALGYFLYFRILAAAGATNLLLVTLLIPVSAVLLGVGVLDETLTTKQLVGMSVIALGLVVMDGRLLKRGC